MRFRFCGELDAPDWLLAEISTLSKLSSVRVRLIVGQVVSHIALGYLDSEKLAKQALGLVGQSDVCAAVAALHFVLTNAAKYEVEELVLLKELEQLGLPKEHAEAVCKPYSKDRERLRSALLASSLQLDAWKLAHWSIDEQLSTGGDARGNSAPVGALSINLEFAAVGAPSAADAPHQRVVVRTDASGLKLLVHELKQARQAMREASEA